MSFITDAINKLFPAKSNRSTGKNTPAIYPVPTPSQQSAFGGTTSPIPYKTDMSTGNLTTEPSWDADRYTDTSQMDKNLEQNNIARVLSGNTPAQVVPTGQTAQLQVHSGSASTVTQILRGATSQTANLTEWQNSNGTTLASIDSSGAMSASAYKVGATNGIDKTITVLDADGSTTHALTFTKGILTGCATI